MGRGQRIAVLLVVGLECWLKVSSQSFECDFGSDCLKTSPCGFAFAGGGEKWSFTSGASSILGKTGPKRDHTGSGCYAYAKPGLLTSSSSRRLITPAIKTVEGAAVGCVRLYYYMFGADVGTLTVYVQESASDERLIWNVTGDQGEKWNRIATDLYVTNASAHDIRIVIEASVNTTSRNPQGDIAVDDVFVTSALKCEAIPETTAARPTTTSPTTKTAAAAAALSTRSTTGPRQKASCDFGSNCFLPELCGFSIPSDSQKWSTSAKGATSLLETGPRFDRTTGKGCFLYANSRNLATGSRYVLESPWLSRTPGVTAGCVSFYYHMYGADVGALRVYLVNSANASEQLLWSRRGNQGNLWKRLESTMNLTESSEPADIKIVFELLMPNKTNSNVLGDMALDDISVTTSGACPQPEDSGSDNIASEAPASFTVPLDVGSTTTSPGVDQTAGSPKNFSCNFGTDCLLANYCGFNWPKESSKWVASATRTTALASTGPQYDHTTGKGCFLYANSRDRPSGSKYVLESPWIETTPGVGAGCVSFYYHMLGDDVGTLGVYVVESPNATRQLIWSRSGNQGSSWNRLEKRVNFTTNGTNAVRVTFEVLMPNKTGSGVSADVALDDIFITTSGVCGQPFDNGTDNFPTSTVPPTTKAVTKATPSVTTAEPGARQNFTCNFGTECYIRDFCGFQTPAASPRWSASAVKVRLFDSTGPSNDHTTGKGCFLYANSRNLPAPGGYKYELLSPWVERTPGALGGCVRFYYYMYGQDVASLRVYVSESRNATARLIWSRSGDQGAAWRKLEQHLNFTASESTEIRLTFEAVMPNSTGSSVAGDVALDDIYVTTNGFCKEPFDNSTDNEVIRTVLSATATTPQATKQATPAPTTREPGWRRNFTCDFGTDCYLSSKCELFSPAASAKWSVASSVPAGLLLTGPTGDHTTGKGCFIYANSRSAPAGSKFVLRTAWIERTAGERVGCASFYYHMYGEDVGTLRLYVESAGSSADGAAAAAQPIWSRSGNQGISWKKLEAHVNMTGLNETADIRLIFEVTMLDLGGPNSRGDVALDDIFVSTAGSCAQPEDSGEDYFPTRPASVAIASGSLTTTAPSAARTTSPQQPSENFTCDFGSDCFVKNVCGFTTPSESPSWSCATAGTSALLATGPTSDHTGKGSYVFANSRSSQQPNSKYVLRSPWLVKPAAARSGCVRLYYHMYGADVGTMTVYVEQSSNSTGRQLWKASGDQGNAWSRMERSVDFDPASADVAGEFRIVIEVLMPDKTGSSVEGDVAVDDVYISALYTCSSPTGDVVGATGATRTTTAATTGRSPLGRPTLFPPTDGTSPGQRENVTCDFGDTCFSTGGYCGFSPLPDSLAWRCATGRSDVLGNTGPERDRSGRGAYVYAKSQPGSKYTLLSPRIAKPSGTATAGCVSMYYHMYGADVGTLSVFVGYSANSSRQLLWTASGNQGKQWQRMERQLPFQGLDGLQDFQIVIEAVMRNRTRGELLSDIAVDDVYISALYECTAPTDDVVAVTDEPAATSSAWTSARPTIADATRIFACKFGTACLNNDFCGMSRNVTWVTGPIYTLLSPLLPSKLPSADHSTADGKGCYAYVNAKSESIQTSHILVSPWMTATPTDSVICVRLYYYLYGNESGLLKVYSQNSTAEGKELLWEVKTGSYNASWQPLNVSANISGRGVERYRIYIEAVTEGDKKNSVANVIAIDDVQIAASQECTYVFEPAQTTAKETPAESSTSWPISTSTANHFGHTSVMITCEPACRNKGSCVNGTCQCQPGYSGTSCGQVDVPVIGKISLNLNYTVISSSKEVMASFWNATQRMLTALTSSLKSSDSQLKDVTVVNITEGSVVISFTAVLAANATALPLKVASETISEPLAILNNATVVRSALLDELQKYATSPDATIISNMVLNTDQLISKPMSLIEDRGKCKDSCHESSSCTWHFDEYRCTCTEGYVQDTSRSRCYEPARQLAVTKAGLSQLDIGLIAGACTLVLVIIFAVVVIRRCTRNTSKSEQTTDQEKGRNTLTSTTTNEKTTSTFESQVEMKTLDTEAAPGDAFKARSVQANELEDKPAAVTAAVNGSDISAKSRGEQGLGESKRTRDLASTESEAMAAMSRQHNGENATTVTQIQPKTDPQYSSPSSDVIHDESESSESLITEL